MNILAFTELLQNKFRDFKSIHDESGIAGVGKSLAYIRDILDELKQFTIEYTFQNVDEEIAFFKEHKPVLLSQYFFYKERFSLALLNSFRDKKKNIENYSNTLRRMERFAIKNESFYAYCMSGATNLDKEYFTRNSNYISFQLDRRFSTGYDIILSRILANELIKEYILDVVRKCNDHTGSNSSALTWTAAKTDLIELVYALHATGVFNNAKVDIRAIVETFEGIFNVELGNYYRTFLGIRIRKTGSTTFLDQLRTRLIQRIRAADGEGGGGVV